MKYYDINMLRGKSVILVTGKDGKYQGQPGFFELDYGEIRFCIGRKSMYHISELRILDDLLIDGYDFVVVHINALDVPKQLSEFKIWG